MDRFFHYVYFLHLSRSEVALILKLNRKLREAAYGISILQQLLIHFAVLKYFYGYVATNVLHDDLGV
jgi:hypothetical protein